MRKSIGVLRAIMVICYFVALGFIGKYELDLILFTTLCRGVMVNIVIMTVCGIVSDILERRI